MSESPTRARGGGDRGGLADVVLAPGAEWSAPARSFGLLPLGSFSLPGPSATWVFTGDSITQAVHHTHGARSWVEHLHERIRWELDRLDDIVVNSGVSGWTVPDVAGRFDHLVARFAPTVVSIALGTNDAAVGPGAAGLEAFAAGLDDLVGRSGSLGATVVLHTPVLVLPDAPENRRRHLGAYAERVRAVAVERGAVLVDHEARWRERFGDAEPTSWMDDHTHPNAVGHRQMAQTTLAALGLGPLETHD